MKKYDVIVVGVGAMGSSACYHLARRGASVLGLERFDIPHAMGGSSGFSRLIRHTYWEHPDYVALLVRAYELWRQLENESGQKLLYVTGGLYMGRPDCDLVARSVEVARQYQIEHAMYDQPTVTRRYPQFHLPRDFVAYHEHEAGFLIPELSIVAHAELAMHAGAELHGREAVRSWRADGSAVTVETDRATYKGDKLVLCSGAWSGDLLRDAGIDLQVTRQVLAWVWPKKTELFELGTLPCWAVDLTGPAEDRGLHYGFPMMHDAPGLKVALHYPLKPTDPDAVHRDLLPEDEQTIRPVLQQVLPDADGPLLSMRTCLYTNSRDSHFIVDQHPNRSQSHGRVTIACGFSGHGFKFSSVIGEALADLASAGSTNLPIDFLRLSRFDSR